jgi:hypothetical protein
MNYEAGCSTCATSISCDSEAGLLACHHCASPLWYCRLNGKLIVATNTELESRFGCQTEDLTPQESLELLRAWFEDEQEEPWHLWDADDYGEIESNRTSLVEPNPYQPPRSIPKRTDDESETFVFRAAVPCDEASLDWATTLYSVGSDVAVLVFVGGLFLSGFGIYLLDQLGVLSWISNLYVVGVGIVVVIAIRRWAHWFMSPYQRVLKRRCQQDPLLQGDYYWIAVRPQTMTACTESGIQTWSLREVRCRFKHEQMVVLRVAPRRLLYVPSTSSTLPEDFALFSKFFRKRLRKFWRDQFFQIEL